MSFESTVQLNYGQEKVTTTGKKKKLGTRASTPDGRIFYYAQAGAVALIPHVLVQQKVANDTTQHAISIVPGTGGDWSATAGNVPIGSVTISVAWVTGKAIDEYTDGYMWVETSPGRGVYRIDADPTTGSSLAASNIRLHPDDGIAIQALTTASQLGFQPNPYSSVLVHAVVAGGVGSTGLVLGVTPTTVAAASYFWAQTSGIAGVIYDDLIAALIGSKVLAGAAVTAGHAGGAPQTTVSTTAAIGTTLTIQAHNAKPVIGYALQGIPADGDVLKVMLSIRA